MVGINDFKLEPVDVVSILTRERYVESFAAAFEIAINFSGTSCALAAGHVFGRGMTRPGQDGSVAGDPPVSTEDCSGTLALFGLGDAVTRALAARREL